MFTSRAFVGSLPRLVVFMWVALALPARAIETVALQLSWHHQFQFAGYYVAKARGYYREAGLEVELRPGGPAAPRPVEAVASGRAEFGVGNAGLAIERMDGVPVVALAAVFQSSPAVWIAPGRLDPLDPEAWRTLPRRLTLPERDHSELEIALFRDTTPVHRPPSTPKRPMQDRAAGPALTPAYLSTEPERLRAAGVEFSVFHPRDHGVDFYSDVLFTSESFAGTHRGTVARFRAASLRGWAEAFADPEGTARLIRDLYAPETSLDALLHEARILRGLAQIEDVELGHMSRRRWESTARMQRESGLGRSPLDVDGFVYQPAESRDLRWPDPVRVAFGGLLAALLLGSVHLLRVNGRLVRDNQSLIDQGRGRQAAELRFQFLMDVAPFPIALYALTDGSVLYANDRALHWSASSDMVGHPIQTWLPALAPDGPLTARLRSGLAIRDHEVELPTPPGQQDRWGSITGRAIEYDGSHCAFVAFRDISARKQAEREIELLSEQRALMLRDVESLQKKLREASIRDALTGLYNRRHFDGMCDREFARCRRERLPVGMLVVDADHFKRVNDRYGHAGGDDVLRGLGSILAASFRTEDIVCRYGGEEFVVLMPGADPDGVGTRAEALRRAVESSVVTSHDESIRFTVSIGAAVGDPATETPATLFARADEAVYAAKAGGRNRVAMAKSADPVTDAAGAPAAAT